MMKWTLATLILLPQFGLAKNLVPMFFPAEQNSLQVLPQRFEYTVVDEKRIQIGDIVIDANRFSFQVSSNPTESAIKFVWPAGLMTTGQLVIKDNAGKAIFSEVIKPEGITISPSEDPNETGIRGERAELVVRNLPQSLLMGMRTYPFMQLCLFNEQTNTRIYLCSPEVYLNRENDGQFRIRPRSFSKKTAFVQINGKEVGPQGIVFLNDPDESLSFRSLSQNGATLEIETRMKSVDFKDVYQDTTTGKVILTGVGGEPADDKSILKKQNDEWQVALDPTRPILFLKGESNIPLRQEFFIKGKLPLDSFRPQLAPSTRKMTYHRSLDLRGTHPAGTSVRAVNGGGQVKKRSGKENFEWSLKDLPAGDISRHQLQVQTPSGNFIGAFDLFKAHPFALSASGIIVTPENSVLLNTGLQMWLESLFGSEFRWGVEAQYRTQLQKSSDTLDQSHFELKALYRLKEGFHLVDPSPSIGGIFRQLTIESTSLSLIGFQYRHESLYKAQNWSRSWMDWLNYYGQIYLPSSSGDVTYNYGLSVGAEALKKGFRKDLWYQGKVSLMTDQIEGSKNEFNLGVEGGIIWQF